MADEPVQMMKAFGRAIKMILTANAQSLIYWTSSKKINRGSVDILKLAPADFLNGADDFYHVAAN